MSSGNDNVFARWSRRKLAVRPSESEAGDDGQQASDAIAEQVETDQQTADTERKVEFAEAEASPAEPLPRVEDLTAESDLSAFLCEGVPKALKSAAMRKMWSLDPGIRDYVGPAEYAWDFNQPGSMSGFGPLDAGKAVVNFLSKIGSATDTEAEKAAAVPEIPEAQPREQLADSSENPATAAPETASEVASSDGAPGPQPLPANAPSAAPDGVHEAGAPTETAEAEPRLAARPRHGSAMPR